MYRQLKTLYSNLRAEGYQLILCVTEFVPRQWKTWQEYSTDTN